MFSVARHVCNFAMAMATLLVAGVGVAQQKTGNILQDAASGALRPASIPVNAPAGAASKIRAAATRPQVKTMPFFSSGLLNAAHQAVTFSDFLQERQDAAGFGANDNPVAISRDTLGCAHRNSDGDVRVNQDCTYRSQAEEKIVFNPAQPSNLVAGLNDGRVGFNQCSIAWSLDNGNTWGDLLPPFRAKVNFPAFEEPTPADPNRHTIAGGPGTLHSYDAGSDPAPAFDSRGNSFFSCIAFDVFSNASMVYVTQSPQQAHGSFFFTIPTFGRTFIVTEDNNPAAQHDKEFVTADTYKNSPNRDNVYVTWTVFKFSTQCGSPPDPNNPQECASPIFGSMSTNHGLTWSTPEEISGASTTLCFFGNFFDPTRSPSACDFDQGSDPIVLPNGDLEVVFRNGNTAADDPNSQQLAVHCRPTGNSPNGTAHLNCAAPAKVGEDVQTGEPACDFGRGPEECIPGAFIRTNDFPRIAVNRRNGKLYATWQDYRNGEFDIQLSTSSNGGLTWKEVGTVNPDGGLDHYFAAIDTATLDSEGDGENQSEGDKHNASTGDRVGISYFRTERVPNENTTPFPGGFAPCSIPLFVSPVTPAPPCQPGVGSANSDYVLSGGRGMAPPFNFVVVSPPFPPPDGNQAGFNGDYSGLAINHDEEAHPIWSDTRNVNPFGPPNVVIHDEDGFTTAVSLPNGTAQLSKGRIGSGSQNGDHDNNGHGNDDN